MKSVWRGSDAFVSISSIKTPPPHTHTHTHTHSGPSRNSLATLSCVFPSVCSGTNRDHHGLYLRRPSGRGSFACEKHKPSFRTQITEKQTTVECTEWTLPAASHSKPLLSHDEGIQLGKNKRLGSKISWRYLPITVRSSHSFENAGFIKKKMWPFLFFSPKSSLQNLESSRMS